MRIGQKPQGGPYVISANRPIRARSRHCRAVAEDLTTVECDLPKGKEHAIVALLYGGPTVCGWRPRPTNVCSCWPGPGMTA
jgi:hypothetical protein